MSSKLTVIFYIVLCLEAGAVLTLLPWIHPFGLGDWGDNYFLLYASQQIGLQSLQNAVSSGWVRGAVTGLGLLNLGMAGWEIAHFRQTVRSLQTQQHAPPPPAIRSPAARTFFETDADAPDHDRQASTPVDLSDYQRRDDPRDHLGQ